MAKDFDDFVAKISGGGLYSEQLEKLDGNALMRVQRTDNLATATAAAVEYLGERELVILRSYHEWLHDQSPS